MSEFLNKSIYVFDEHGNGRYTIEWPWNDAQVDHLDSIGETYAILDKGFPDAYWMDVASEEKTIYLRETISPTIDLSRLTTEAGSIATISGLPSPAILLVNGEPIVATDGSCEISSNEPGEYWVAIGGPHKGDSFQIIVHDLGEYRTSVKATVDADAEASRNRVITPGSGQAMTYLRKAEAARVFLAGGLTSGPQYDRIDDEAERLGVTMEQAASSIVAIADGWEAMDRMVDKVRLDTKKAIDLATTLDDIDAAYSGATWPA